MTDLNLNDNKLFYSIKEVSELLDLKETVLRFWEKSFRKSNHKKARVAFVNIRKKILK